ncbi:hypothetical protein BN1200_440124 [Klebsiella variicola]|nr:hypothetical protein BN1200_440124 [Klebsiella variicola]
MNVAWIMYLSGESPYAEGRTQHCFYLLNRKRESWRLAKGSSGGTRHHNQYKQRNSSGRLASAGLFCIKKACMVSCRRGSYV